jgi:hypothetical protein
MNVLAIGLLLYLIYRFVAGFLIPLFGTARHMRQQFHNMDQTTTNSRSETSAQGSRTAGTAGKPTEPKTGSSKVGEYIDFEEIK